MISRIYYAARGPAVALLSLLLFASAARPSDADAIAISNSIQANHWPYGTILDPMYASATSDQITDYTRCGDSAIWTGHYLAAEAFRYNVTGAADALTNVKAAIAGIQGLVDVTGTGVLARCQFPASSPYAASIASQESSNGIFTNTSTGYQWVGNTSRDEYSGVFFGLGVTYDMVNDAGVQSSVSSLVTTLLDFLRNHAWTVVMPGGSVPTTFVGFADEQLSFMNVGLHVNPQHYAGDWELSSSLLALEVPVPIGVDLAGGTGSYFKFNLDEIDLYNLIRLDSSSNHSIFTGAYSLLWGYLGSHQNAFFNMITRALNGANSTRDSQTVTLLNQWLLRPTRDVAVDLVGQFPSCGSTDEACQPVPVPLRPTTDFLWQRDPFELTGTGDGTIESAGIDYILPYWMARYYDLVTSASVVNAALPTTTLTSTTVSPESIASLYGSNLATAMGSATSASLPQTLDGATVTVTDSVGTARPAPLFYVSPTQINFEIPSGTALGQASVSIAGQTTTANVAAVAPGIFAASLLNSGGSEYVILYGTGIRNAELTAVQATANGTAETVSYAGPQGQYDGLDQVNIAVPGIHGVAVIALSVDGQSANPVTLELP
jgi:uncharacterized protein (TIGR03437 family)